MSCITYNNRKEIVRGDTKTFTIFVYDSSGLMNLEGYDGWLGAKKFPYTINSSYDISVGASDVSSGGILTFQLSSNDTMVDSIGDYSYKVVIDNGVNRHTVVQNVFNIHD